MTQPPKKSSMARKIAAVILIIIVAAVGIYAGLTYPRVIVSFSVSFTVGAQSEQKELDVPFLHKSVQVEVSVTSGTALWDVWINYDGFPGSKDHTLIWRHYAVQSGQTVYTSEWIPLSTGSYNFTLEAIGFGTLNADVSVTSKGGFW